MGECILTVRGRIFMRWYVRSCQISYSCCFEQDDGGGKVAIRAGSIEVADLLFRKVLLIIVARY